MNDIKLIKGQAHTTHTHTGFHNKRSSIVFPLVAIANVRCALIGMKCEYESSLVPRPKRPGNEASMSPV